MTRPVLLALLAVTGLALILPAPAHAWGFAAASRAGDRPVRVLTAHAAGPPSAAFSAASAALCSSRGVACVAVGTPSVNHFNAVAAGEFDGVLAEVCVRIIFFQRCFSVRMHRPARRRRNSPPPRVTLPGPTRGQLARASR
jgi:hypothetical protein